MTLKDKMQQVEPECVNEKYVGGVKFCPDNYSYLNCDRDKLQDKCIGGMRCRDCWNQEYIEPAQEEEPEHLTWRQNIINRFMRVI